MSTCFVILPTLSRFPGEMQMTDVDRSEGAAEDGCWEHEIRRFFAADYTDEHG